MRGSWHKGVRRRPRCLALPNFFLAFNCFIRKARAYTSFSSASSSGTTPSLALTSTPPTCNVSTYENWYDSPYSGSLTSALSGFWLFGDAELTNGQAMEVVSSTCQLMMDQLRLDRAGRNGPVRDKFIYDIMCSEECVFSDELREDAMDITGCNCLELSSQPDDPTYHIEGDWCQANTGRILCQVFDQCGSWNCHISDFMCPRYEYNKFHVQFRGLGDCSGALGARKLEDIQLILPLIVVTFAWQLAQ